MTLSDIMVDRDHLNPKEEQTMLTEIESTIANLPILPCDFPQYWVMHNSSILRSAIEIGGIWLITMKHSGKVIYSTSIPNSIPKWFPADADSYFLAELFSQCSDWLESIRDIPELYDMYEPY
jgi:hypothetical protein